MSMTDPRAVAKELAKAIYAKAESLDSSSDCLSMMIDVLDTVLADAERRGMERAAIIVEQCSRELEDCQWQSKLTCHTLTEAIRAQAQADKEE